MVKSDVECFSQESIVNTVMWRNLFEYTAAGDCQVDCKLLL